MKERLKNLEVVEFPSPCGCGCGCGTLFKLFGISLGEKGYCRKLVDVYGCCCVCFFSCGLLCECLDLLEERLDSWFILSEGGLMSASLKREVKYLENPIGRCELTRTIVPFGIAPVAPIIRS
jgi:hypothetical protein